MGAHWVWASDSVLRRSALFDADTGRMLGMVNGGEGVSPLHPHVSRARREVYVVETVYSRGHRGERTDLVTIYDAVTLAVSGEVLIPPRRADNGNGVAIAALLDGERFLVVLNQNPGTSVSVVDLEARAFVGEIATPGCALVLPAGERRFGMLCGDGTAESITLEIAGGEAARARSERFFDATNDPLTEKGVRDGARWRFASFDGLLHEIDFAGEAPVAAPPWSLFSEAERTEGWRIGGLQHLALHAPSGRLYSVVHQGEAGSHKDAGPEVWVYDLAARARVRRIELANLTAAFLRPRIGIEAGSFPDRLLSALLPNPGADTLAVTRDEAPLLLAGERESGAVGVYDATTGEHLRDLEETGIGGGLLVVP
jgi:methylamine dehydrogenase heavy chain